MERFVNKPLIYWLVNILLIGPLILLWAGVAYWFGFASGVIMKTVFPPILAPVLLTSVLLSGLTWTALHLRHSPKEKQVRLRVDLLLLAFIVFSILMVVGQMMNI